MACPIKASTSVKRVKSEVNVIKFIKYVQAQLAISLMNLQIESKGELDWNIFSK